MRSPPPSLILGALGGLAALALPVAQRVVEAPVDPDADPLDPTPAAAVTPLHAWDQPLLLGALLLLVAAAFAVLLLRDRHRSAAAVLLAGTLAGLGVPALALAAGLAVGLGAWLAAVAALFLLWRLLTLLSLDPARPLRLLVPALFGVAMLYGWEIGVRGLGVPLILLPPPSLIAVTLAQQWPVLAGDFVQTVLRSALRGYLIGCALGFGLAVLCDRLPWLGRGLLPYGNLVSAVPMVGIAPIMIMWFGFDWPSKAAVVVVTTLFPMLVSTLTGLQQTDRLQLDLMRSYAAGYGRTLLRVRLPNAMPLIFAALKVNATFALISAIVAEFFGTPIAGMGFRISTEVARMNLGMVWATIVVAALAGSAAYGGLALIERAVTSWHPSYRER